MIKIIHSTNKKRILGYNMDEGEQYLLIDMSDELASDNCPSLFDRVAKIEVEKLSDEERSRCEKEYIDTIGHLGSLYNSFAWWANSVSEKNEHISDLYRNLCSYYCLIKTLNRYSAKCKNIFLICSREIFEPLKIFCLHRQIILLTLDNGFFFMDRKNLCKTS